MNVYPVSEPFPECPINIDSTAGLYLGALATDPVTTVIGTYYWNTASNLFRIWNGNWINATLTAFNGIVNGGNSSRIDTIKVRGDAAANWTIANPILLAREIGLETDTTFFKFGDGTTHWIALPYSKVLSSNVIGLDNVNNTSDLNKPVSTAQTAAIVAALDTAKAYTDTSLLNVLIDQGSYISQITGLFPTGTIKKGYLYEIADTGLLGGISVKPMDTIRALIDNPGQDITNWLFTPSLVNEVKPYIVSASPVYGRPISNAICISHEFVLPVTFPVNLTGSKALVKSTKKATNTSIFKIKKNDIQVGSITFTNASTIGAFTFTNPITFNIGDVLDVYAPSPADPTLADIVISLYGTR